MRKTDYMSKWKMGIGSAFLMVMLAGCGSGMQDLASGAGDVSLVSLDAAEASPNQSRSQEIFSDMNISADQEQQTTQTITQQAKG